MTQDGRLRVAGIDAGTECTKVLVLDEGQAILGRAVVPTRGYFQDCIHEALSNAVDEAQLTPADLDAVCVTGFGASCSPIATVARSETACHARGASFHHGQAMTVVDIGGRDPKVITVDAQGRAVEARSVRKCAVGIGTFLMFTARHLDVHPTRLMDLVASDERPVRIGGYCSVFAEVEVIEHLRRGVAVGEIALGAMHSIAERILEVGRLEAPVVVTGGVCEYFPGVVTALSERASLVVETMPEPILVGALGAALFALDAANDPVRGE